MDIPLLLSGLNEVRSLSDPIKDLYDANQAIPEIIDASSIDALMALHAQIYGHESTLSLPTVNIAVMEVHLTVIKPFVSQSDDEDDFI